jgi:hypothetical protein
MAITKSTAFRTGERHEKTFVFCRHRIGFIDDFGFNSSRRPVPARGKKNRH